MVSFWKQFARLNPLKPLNSTGQHSLHAQDLSVFSLDQLDDQLAATSDFVTPGNLIQMENGCLSPRSAAAQASSHRPPAPTPPPPPPPMSIAPPTHSTANTLTVDPQGQLQHQHHPLAMSSAVEPSFSGSLTSGPPWYPAASPYEETNVSQQSIQQQLLLEQHQLQQTMEHHRLQYEHELQQQQQQLQPQSLHPHVQQHSPASQDAPDPQRDTPSCFGSETQGNFKPDSGLVLDPMPGGLKGTDGTSSSSLGNALGSSDGRLASSGGELSSSGAGLGPGAAGKGGGVGGGGLSGHVFNEAGVHSERFTEGESSMAGGGGGAAGEYGGGGAAIGGGLGPSPLCCAGVAGVASPKRALGPPQGVSNMQVHDHTGSHHPQQQQQQFQQQQNHRQEQPQFQQLPPQEYVNWEGETVYVTQETLEDSGSPEAPPSYLAASPSQTHPPPHPAFAPPSPTAPTHMAPPPPSDWSISSTLPSSSLHPEYAAPTGAMPPLPNMYGDPRASMQYGPAAAPSFPPTQASLPGVSHSSPRDSMRLGGEVDGLGMGSQKFRGGLNGMRASSPCNPAAGSFVEGMGSMLGLSQPPLPSQLAAPPAALPMQYPGLESQLAALQLSSRDMEQGLRTQLAEMEHLLKAKDMQLVAATDKAEALQTEVQAGQNRSEALQAELAIRDGRMDALQAELTAARKDLEQERLRGAEEGVGMDRLKAELLKLRNELEIAHKKLDMSSEDERRLRMEVQGLHKDNGMLSDTTLQLKMEVSEGQERLRALFEDQQRLKAQAARAEVSSENLAAQVQEMRLRCISLEDQAGQLKHELFYAKEDATRSRTQAEVFAKRLLHLRSTMDAAPPPSLNPPPQIPDPPFSPTHSMPTSAPPYQAPSWAAQGSLRNPPPSFSSSLAPPPPSRPLSAPAPPSFALSEPPLPPYATSASLNAPPPFRPPLAYNGMLPPTAADPLGPPSAGFGAPSPLAPDPPRPSSAYAGVPFPYAPPPSSTYGGSVAMGSSSSGQQQQPLPLTSSLLAPPALTALGGPPSGSLDLGPRTNPFPAPHTPPKTQAEPPKPTIAPHMQAPFATSTGPPPEITKPNAPQHVPGLDVPFGTERTLQEFLSRTQALESQVVKLSQEKGQLEAEYAKMPLHGGRTAKERSRKAEVEERIEVLNKAISQQRLLLKQMQPRGR